jgi:hypothetical protein
MKRHLLVHLLPFALALPGAASQTPPRIDWHLLASYKVTPAMLNARPGRVCPLLPKAVRSMDGQEVALTGFMLPTQVHNRMAQAFLLLRSQSTCCFGVPPELNEVVEVLQLKQPAKILMDTPVRAVGRLHVRERWEGTFLCSVYQLDLESVEPDSGKVQ